MRCLKCPDGTTPRWAERATRKAAAVERTRATRFISRVLPSRRRPRLLRTIERNAMEKWADYVITGKELSADGKHVAEVLVRKDLGDRLGPGHPWTKNRVLHEMLLGRTFWTSTRNASRRFRKGAMVRHLYLEGADELYIRSDHDRTRADNLRNLPDIWSEDA